MKKSSALILVFSIVFVIFFIGPPLLGGSFGPYPLMEIADVVDIFTPLVLLPLYWLLYRVTQKTPTNTSGIVILFILAAFWVAGQGMHLSANSIGHLLEGMENTDIYKLTHFYDEVLSHYLWHFGIAGLAAFLIISQRRNTAIEEQTQIWSIAVAGVIHGFTLFLITIEAGTAPLGITFSVLAVLFCIIWGRKIMSQRPLLTFFFISFIIAILFFIGWGAYHGGLPQFSEVGII